MAGWQPEGERTTTENPEAMAGQALWQEGQSLFKDETSYGGSGEHGAAWKCVGGPVDPWKGESAVVDSVAKADTVFAR